MIHLKMNKPKLALPFFFLFLASPSLGPRDPSEARLCISVAYTPGLFFPFPPLPLFPPAWNWRHHSPPLIPFAKRMLFHLWVLRISFPSFSPFFWSSLFATRIGIATTPTLLFFPSLYLPSGVTAPPGNDVKEIREGVKVSGTGFSPPLFSSL